MVKTTNNITQETDSDRKQLPKEVLYTGLFVKDTKKLKEIFPPAFDKTFYHHSTIKFRPENLENINIGKKHKLTIIGKAKNEVCEALLVKNEKSQNKFPHITLSLDNTKMPSVDAVYSNSLLEKATKENTIEYFKKPIKIDVIEGFSDGDNEFTEKHKNIEEKIIENLDSIAKILIENIPENKLFITNPDSIEEHEKNWHQFGIITHTKKFLELLRTEGNKYLKKRGIYKEIFLILSEKIDNKKKKELLEIAVILHDIGKFARDFSNKEHSPYYKHEEKGEKILIENKTIRTLLYSYGLTDKQIEYIGKCIGLHYELGKVREKAKKHKLGYTILFSQQEECRNILKQVLENNKGFEIEIGLLFLGDSLAKTDIIINGKDDNEIEQETENIKKKILEKNISPNLINAIKQRPINIEIAKNYLQEAIKIKT